MLFIKLNNNLNQYELKHLYMLFLLLCNLNKIKKNNKIMNENRENQKQLIV